MNDQSKHKFKLVRNDKAIKEKFNFIINAVAFLAPVFILTYFFRGIISVYLLIVFAVPFMLIIPKIVRTFYSDWIKKKDIIGFIEFETEKIVLDDRKIIIVNEIEKIELNFNYIKGKIYNPRDIIHNGLAEIFISLKNNDEQKFVFLIESKKQLDYLSCLLKEYYRKKIIINEYMFNSKLKTILLRPNWKYNELQSLKKELNIETL